jgi:diguanylate cyclase (GGDEF)-like protein/PAS domain S-box-containing protein
METSRGRPLAETLQAVADGVVGALGFGTAAVNFVLPDGNLRVSALTGPPEARAALLGKVIPRYVIDDLLARSETWGALRFAPHGTYLVDPVFEWVPESQGPVDEHGWHPEDALLAPMYDADANLVGLISVDDPVDGRRPSPLTCELLEIFAVQAGIAISVARLMDEVRHERDRLSASESAFRFFFTASAGAMVTVDLADGEFGRIVQANEAFCRMMRGQRLDIQGAQWIEFVLPEERADTLQHLRCRADGEELRADRCLLRSDGTTFWAGLTGAAIALDPGRPSILLIHIDDISDHKTREASLMEMASLDPLTGVLNRRAFVARLDAAITAAASPGPGGPRGLVVYADLVKFKLINDRYGHAAGDAVLKAAANRMRELCRDADTVARIGGDEFAVLLPGIDPSTTAEILDRVRVALRQPVAGVPDDLLDVSLGAVPLAGRGLTVVRDAEALLHAADMAMYADKLSSRTHEH